MLRLCCRHILQTAHCRYWLTTRLHLRFPLPRFVATMGWFAEQFVVITMVVLVHVVLNTDCLSQRARTPRALINFFVRVHCAVDQVQLAAPLILGAWQDS